MIVYKSRLLKKSSNQKFELVEPSPVNAGHCVAFKHSMTDLAANFECNRFRITPDIVAMILGDAI